MSKWENQKYAYLIKKKSNGYPNGREIGEKLEIIDYKLNPKYTRITIKGNRSVNDTFNLHESFLYTEFEMRDKLINYILDDNF